MRVLIIEDDDIWQCKLQIIAEKAGLDVMPLASSLEQAKAYLETATPDLIIADVYLNHERVFKLFNTHKYRKIPTIFTTASQDENDFKMASKVEQFTFLVKPFHQYTLLSAIKTLITPKSSDLIIETETSDLKITSIEIKRFYKLLGNDALLDIFGLTVTEKHILKQRWHEQRTFTDIGKDIQLTGQRIQRLYTKIVNKIKVRIVNNVPKYNDFLNFSKTKKNKLEILKNSVELQKKSAAEFDLKTSINSIEELGTKLKNVLLEKDIKTIEDLVQYSKKELSLFKRLGHFGVLEIEKSLLKYGFELK